MDKFIKIPAQLTTGREVKESELTDQEPEWYEGFVIINIEEIAYICANTKSCSVYFKSGDYIEVNLEIDELALLIGCK